MNNECNDCININIIVQVLVLVLNIECRFEGGWLDY